MTIPIEKKDDATLIRARALASAGRMAWFELDLPVAHARLEESLALFRQSQDRIGTLHAMSSLILVLTRQAEIPVALGLLTEAVSMLQHIPDHLPLLPVLAGLARSAAFMFVEETLPYAHNLGEEAAHLARVSGDKRSLAWALDSLALYSYHSGNYAAARCYLEEGIPLYEELGELWGVSFQTWLLANVARREGRREEAWMLNRQSITIQSQHNSRQGMPYMLETFAFLAIEEKQLHRATRLLAAAEKLRRLHDNMQQPLYQVEYQSHLANLRAMLEEPEFEAAWAHGRAMTIEDAIVYALEEPNTDVRESKA